MCVCAYIYIYICVCTWIYTYTYLHMYIYPHTSIQHGGLPFFWWVLCHRTGFDRLVEVDLRALAQLPYLEWFVYCLFSGWRSVAQGRRKGAGSRCNTQCAASSTGCRLKFSKLILLLNWLCKLTIYLTFKNFHLHLALAAAFHAGDVELVQVNFFFSKISSLPNVLCKMTIQLTLDNFYQLLLRKTESVEGR